MNLSAPLLGLVLTAFSPAYGLFTPSAVLSFLAGMALYLTAGAVAWSGEKPR